MLALLLNLLLLVALLVGIVVFLVFPKATLLFGVTLGVAYVGTQSYGFLGTVGGLVLGGIAGAILSGIAFSIEISMGTKRADLMEAQMGPTIAQTERAAIDHKIERLRKGDLPGLTSVAIVVSVAVCAGWIAFLALSML